MLDADLFANLDKRLTKQFGYSKLAYEIENFQVFFNRSRIDSLNLDFGKIKESTIDYL